MLTGRLDSLELVRKLLQHGANVNARQTKEPKDGFRNMLNRIGATPFLLAAKSVDIPLMRLLLEHGADPKLTTEDGTTALMAAAGVGIWAPGENPGTEEEALAAVKFVLRGGRRPGRPTSTRTARPRCTGRSTAPARSRLRSS